MQTDANFKFPELSNARKKRMIRSAETMLQAQQTILTNTNQGILQYALQNNTQPISMNHYPQGDRIDHQTGAQYFYHCHREDYDREEHGHFHCFLRYKQIPKHIKPARIQDWDKYIENPMTHLVAVSMNRFGEPIRLFTVNRWISCEIWYDAKQIPLLLNHFKMTLVDPYWQLLDQWVESLLQLFAPQITWLAYQRDYYLSQQLPLNPNDSVYEDERFEELSSINISVAQQIQWLLEQPVFS